jgi:hypothetical protein
VGTFREKSEVRWGATSPQVQFDRNTATVLIASTIMSLMQAQRQEYLKYPASTLLKSSNDLGWSTLTAELRSHSRLRRLSNGGGRHPTTNVPGDPAADRGTAAAATTSASMRRSTVMHSRATDGMSASECQGNRPDQAVKHRSDVGNVGSHPPSRIWASSRFRNAYHPRQFRVHLGNPGLYDGARSETVGWVRLCSNLDSFARIWIPQRQFVALSLARPPDP